MEFKGTKGKWFLSNYDVFTRQEGETDTCLFMSLTTNRLDETKANALLISKAPEMLEMLNHVKGYLGSDQRELVDKLINEATNV